MYFFYFIITINIFLVPARLPVEYFGECSVILGMTSLRWKNILEKNIKKIFLQSYLIIVSKGR